ncbi:MAG TPA: 50S ribosomal protein L12 [archaeon]|nr:50S ribosomal protein L12 [archaeon]
MELIYSALLLHSTKQKIDEENVKKVLHAASASVEESKVKALVASLEGVDIDAAISKAAMPVATAGPAEAKKEEKKEEDTAKKAEEAAAGLGALFG